ncbi:hypothetical protein [Albirhodobacter sp. R86504]|uniref:hypothetical protein n=1 Tax=Albirhodobacter sp. R86504 TaxID=3093848 RepID=UPI00366F7C59
MFPYLFYNPEVFLLCGLIGAFFISRKFRRLSARVDALEAQLKLALIQTEVAARATGPDQPPEAAVLPAMPADAPSTRERSAEDLSSVAPPLGEPPSVETPATEAASVEPLAPPVHAAPESPRAGVAFVFNPAMLRSLTAWLAQN